MPTPGSTVVRRQLGVRLRRLRNAAGKTERDVEEASLASRTKLWKIETGKAPVKVADVRALCWLYGADNATTDALAKLALGTNGQGWWEDYSDVYPFGFGLYVGLESTAAEIRTYNPELVHGLLQTPEYMRALYWAYNPHGTDGDADRMVKMRRERQHNVTGRTPALRLTAVLVQRSSPVRSGEHRRWPSRRPGCASWPCWSPPTSACSRGKSARMRPCTWVRSRFSTSLIRTIPPWSTSRSNPARGIWRRPAS